MNRNFLFFFSAAVLVMLAACGKGDEETKAVENAQPVAAQPATPTATEPTGPNLLQKLQDNSGVLTPQDKAAIVERARTNAQSAAQTVGQSADQVKSAATNAEAAAQRSIEARQPQQN